MLVLCKACCLLSEAKFFKRKISAYFAFKTPSQNNCTKKYVYQFEAV